MMNLQWMVHWWALGELGPIFRLRMKEFLNIEQIFVIESSFSKKPKILRKIEASS
jgi:hypothetical protein